MVLFLSGLNGPGRMLCVRKKVFAHIFNEWYQNIDASVAVTECGVRLVKGEELIEDDWNVSYNVASML